MLNAIVKGGKSVPVVHELHNLLRMGPLGRLLFTRDTGQARSFMTFSTNLHARHIKTRLTPKERDARCGWAWNRRPVWEQIGPSAWARSYDLGSGLVTNVGVLAMANDFAWAAPSGASVATLHLSNNHGTGTGVTAAAATDVQLQTAISTIATPIVAGAQSLISAANLQKYQTVATLSYNAGGPYAVTEWGLLTDTTFSVTTGTPFTATSATSGTATATPYTASSATVQGQQQHVVFPGTTTVWGLILSNTTSVLTIPAWYKVADGTAGATPGATEAFTIKPVLWDHKVFSAINVNNGDSIQFTYTLTVNSGG